MTRRRLPRVAATNEDEISVPPEAATALVWIDSDGARILRWRGRLVTEELDSGVPPHTRMTAHVRHNPATRHGGSGRGQDDAERRRAEHLRAFLDTVAGRLAGDTYVEIVGTGVVGDRLMRLLLARAARQHLRPTVVLAHSNWLTTRELATRLRERLGLRHRRQTVGAYRWSGELPRTRAGAVRGPRRVLDKGPRRDPD
jgi:hypothetical protein